MSSRIRSDPKKIFEVFFEIGKPDSTDGEPFVLQMFPDGYDNKEVIKSVPKFAFPCDYESPAVDHFTFVLTDIESKYKFGFCRHKKGAQTCLCIISCLPWYEVFYNFLNILADITNKTDIPDPTPLLQTVHCHPIPKVNEKVEIISNENQQKFSFTCPDLRKLPSIPENRNLTEYYSAVDADNMTVIFASMLYERRILITSKKLSRLTACVHGSASLIYPMHWQHLYIPILPSHLLDYCSAPMPFIIGVHSSDMPQVRRLDLGDTIILDADTNTVETEHDDLQTLPQEMMSVLKKRLKGQRHQPMLLGDGVARAFLRALVGIIGGYRNALNFRTGEEIKFDPDKFVRSKTESMRPFLEKMLELQIFQQFIEQRLELLNEGIGFKDEFENETNLWADKQGTDSKYKEWLINVKKKGTKIKREGRDKWNDITERVKDKSKRAYKDFRSKIDELTKEEQSSLAHRPHSLHSQGPKPLRPPRPPNPAMRHPSYEKGGRRYNIIDIDTVTISEDRGLEPPNRVSLTLIDDPDIQSTIQRSYSMEDLLDSDISEQGQERKVSTTATLRTSASSEAILDMAPPTGEASPPIPAPRKKRSKVSLITESIQLMETPTDILVDVATNEPSSQIPEQTSSTPAFEDNFLSMPEKVASSDSLTSNLSNTVSNLTGSIEVPNSVTLRNTEQTADCKKETALKRVSVQRREAFRQPASPRCNRAGIVGLETDVQTPSNTNVGKTANRQSSLDIFDPLSDLSSLSIAEDNVDTEKEKMPSRLSSEDSDLLRDWNLDLGLSKNQFTSTVGSYTTLSPSISSIGGPYYDGAAGAMWKNTSPGLSNQVFTIPAQTNYQQPQMDINQKRKSSATLMSPKPFTTMSKHSVVSHVTAPSSGQHQPLIANGPSLNNMTYITSKAPPTLVNSTPQPWTSFNANCANQNVSTNNGQRSQSMPATIQNNVSVQDNSHISQTASLSANQMRNGSNRTLSWETFD